MCTLACFVRRNGDAGDALCLLLYTNSCMELFFHMQMFNVLMKNVSALTNFFRLDINTTLANHMHIAVV